MTIDLVLVYRPKKCSKKSAEVEVLKHTASQKMRGSIPWGWLVTIVILAAAVGLAIVFFPKPAAKTPPPAVVRAKVPVMAPVTAPTPAPTTEQQQSAPEKALQTDGNATGSPEALTTGQEKTAENAAAQSTTATDDQTRTTQMAVADRKEPPQSTVAPPDPSKTSSAPAPATAKPMETASKTMVKSAQTDSAPITKQTETAESDQKEAAKEPEPKAVEQPKPKPQGFAIQVGAYRNKAYAETQLAEMQQRGYDAYIYKVTDAQQRSFYMVRFGAFATREAAAEAVTDFKEQEEMAAVIVRAGSM